MTTLGNVVALTGRNQEAQTLLASYTGYQGRPCTQVVGELVDEINALGYFDATVGGHEKNIILKLERGSAYPSDQFLNELAEAVRLVVETDQIGSQPVTLDQDDYDDAYGDKGYINASAAQSILSTQLGRDDLQFVEKEYDLDDGEYEVEFVLDGVEYEYEVNAYTGKVTEMDAEFQDYDDTDYGPGSDGITDYGVTDYDDTDYGPNADGDHRLRRHRLRPQRRRHHRLRRHGLRPQRRRDHRLRRHGLRPQRRRHHRLRRHGLRPQRRRHHRLRRHRLRPQCRWHHRLRRLGR